MHATMDISTIQRTLLGTGTGGLGTVITTTGMKYTQRMDIAYIGMHTIHIFTLLTTHICSTCRIYTRFMVLSETAMIWQTIPNQHCIVGMKKQFIKWNWKDTMTLFTSIKDTFMLATMAGPTTLKMVNGTGTGHIISGVVIQENADSMTLKKHMLKLDHITCALSINTLPSTHGISMTGSY